MNERSFEDILRGHGVTVKPDDPERVGFMLPMGGYLVPAVIRVNSSGFVAATCRLVGRVLGNERMYERGRYDLDTMQMLREQTERMMSELK